MGQVCSCSTTSNSSPCQGSLRNYVLSDSAQGGPQPVEDFVVDVRLGVEDGLRRREAAHVEDYLGGAVDVGDEGQASNGWTVAKGFQ